MKHAQKVNLTNWRTSNGIGQLKCTTVPWFHGDQKISRHDCTWNYRFVLAPWILKAVGSPSVAFETLNSDSNSSQAAWDYESYELQKNNWHFHIWFFCFWYKNNFPTNIRWLWIFQHVPRVPSTSFRLSSSNQDPAAICGSILSSGQCVPPYRKTRTKLFSSSDPRPDALCSHIILA